MEIFKVEERIVIVKPILKSRNSLITDPNHEAFFLFGNSTNSYLLPMDSNGKLVNPFRLEGEKEWLETELDLDLNYHKIKDNYWYNTKQSKVELGKIEKTLNLANPRDYIEYIVLRANELFIAAEGTPENRYKATQRYAMVSKDHEVIKTGNAADLEVEAYIALGAMKDDKEKMLNFLKIYGKKVSDSSKSEFLKTEIVKIIKEDLRKFIDIVQDKASYATKLLISEAVECGAIIKKGRGYSLPGGDKLCFETETPTLDNAVKYLEDKSNDEILEILKTRVKNHKDK